MFDTFNLFDHEMLDKSNIPHFKYEQFESFMKRYLEAENPECYTYYKLMPESGKKHQLRKQLDKIMSTPILGDTLHNYQDNSRNLFQITLNYDRDFERKLFHQSIFLH